VELVSCKGDIRELFIKAQMEPLCGWPWLEANESKAYPEQSIVVFFNDKVLLDMPSTAKKPGLIKAAMKMAVKVKELEYARKTF
jgi:hypothetical protein